MRLFTLLLTILVSFQIASAQTYAVTSSFNAGNPGGTTFSETTTTGWTSAGIAGTISTNVWSPTITLPFAFNFFGNPVTDCKVSANGLLTFTTSVSGTPPNANGSLPDATLPDNTIAAMWDEFTSLPPTGSNDVVYYQTFGTAPNRQFWVYWFSFEYGNPSVSFVYFATVLEETTNAVYVVDLYDSATPALTSTVGIQLDAATAVQYSSNVAQANNGTANADNDYYAFTPATPCTGTPVPGATAATPISGCPGTSISLSLSGYTPEAGHTYQWESSPDNSSWSAIPGGNSAGFSTIAYSSAYYRCVVTCSNSGMSDNSTSTFVSVSQVSLPYTQAFGTYPATSGSQVDCWSEAAGLIGSPTTFTSLTASNWAVDGFANVGTTGAARCNISGTTTDEWILSPSFNLSGAQQVEFDIALTGSGVTTAATLDADDRILFVVSTDNGATWSLANALQTWNNGTPITNAASGQHVVVNVAAYSGSVRFGFYCESTVTGITADFFVDNFIVQDVPACSQPSGLGVSNPTTTTADLSWTGPGTAPLNYNWLVVTAGAGSGGTPVAAGSVAHPTVTVTATGLTGSTSYDAYVRSVCAGGNSIWVGPVNFTTSLINNDPSGAIALSAGVGQTITTVGATQTLAACTGTADDDVWFTFTPPMSGNYTIAFSGLAGATDIGYQIFNGDPLVAGVSLSCHDGPDLGANFDGWDAASTYYIRAYSWTGTTTTRITGGTITISSYGGTVPSNNGCDAPQALTVSPNGACSYASVTSLGAIYSLGATCITSVNPPANEDDVWMTFTTATAGVYSLKSTSASTYGMALYTGTCGSLVQVNCVTSFTGSTGTTFTLNGSTTYYLRMWNTAITGGTAFDVCIEEPPLTTVFSGTGNWSNPGNWSNGIPNCSSNIASVIIAAGANCTLDISTSCKDLSILGTLNIGAAALTVGCSGNNAPVTVGSGGSLVMSGGVLDIRGRFLLSNGGSFNQTAGDILVDGNDGGNASTSTGTSNLFSIGAAGANYTTTGTFSATGGTITIVDPPQGTSAGYAFVYYGASGNHINIPSTHTLKLGDGASVDPSGYTSGFRLYGFAGSGYLSFGNVVVDALTGTNRHVTIGSGSGILGDVTVSSGDLQITTTNYFAGDITVDATGTLTTTSILYMGSYSNGVISASAFAQTISGAGTFRNSASSPTASVSSFTVNNSGPGVVVDINPWHVSSTLTITAGRVFMGTAGTGTLIHGVTTQPTLSGTYNATGTNYIVGKMRRYVSTTTASDRFFPIGTNSDNRLVTLNPTAVTTAGFLEVSFTAGAPGNTGLPFASQSINIEKVSPTGYWTVDAVTGTPFASANYTLTTNATGFTKEDGVTVVTDLANVRLVKRPTGGSWGTFTTSTTAASAGLASLRAAGLDGFSDFALGGTEAALPVELKAFSAKALDHSNLVEWVTSTERNVAEFIVERSFSGTAQWIEVGRKTATNTTLEKQYSIEDAAPFASTYYRLRTVDFDGAEALSPLVVVQRKAGKFGIVSTFPSPATSVIHVNYEVLEDAAVTLRAFDANGRLVLQQTAEAVKGSNQTVLNVATLQNGIYSVEIQTEKGISSAVRFVKQ